jgi:putative nucleotidyltransferase with HDIG domain
MQRATRNSEPVIPTKQEYRRAESAYQNTRSLTKSLMDEVALGKGINVKEVKKSVSDCVQSVVRNPDTMMWMARMRDEDAYTTEHCLNVGLLAIVFGRHLGLSEQDLEYLGFAGVVHDVGKMKTPKEILNKPGALTKEEFKIMQQHTTDGRNILISQKNIMPHAVDIAFGHHEHLDGSGYPRGVKGNAITPFTRIITLCDIFGIAYGEALQQERCFFPRAIQFGHEHAYLQFTYGNCGTFMHNGALFTLRHGLLVFHPAYHLGEYILSAHECPL